MLLRVISKTLKSCRSVAIVSCSFVLCLSWQSCKALSDKYKKSSLFCSEGRKEAGRKTGRQEGRKDQTEGTSG